MQIFNLRINCDKHVQHQQDFYHAFIDFEKVFDRVWHAALWATMKKYNISANLIRVIKNFYDTATSAVLFNSCLGLGDWFRTPVGVRPSIKGDTNPLIGATDNSLVRSSKYSYIEALQTERCAVSRMNTDKDPTLRQCKN